jgi:3-oxoacyl-[acyl-carrier-protein] synthase II
MAAVFGPAVKGPAMTAPKSMLGHTAGAAGLHGLAGALLSMRDGRVPPVPTLTEPIAEVAGFRIVRGAAARERVRLAQVNAFGFGGVNAVAILAADR